MQEHPERLLSALGVTVVAPVETHLQCCPMHPHIGRTLTVSQNDATGQRIYVCEFTECRFRGTALALAVQALKSTPERVLDMFMPGGTLADTLLVPITQEERASYTAGQLEYQNLVSYLDQCKLALRKAPEFEALRIMLTGGHAYQIPQELGVAVPNGIPRLLSELQAFVPYDTLLYPYTYDGQLVRLDAHATKSPTAMATSFVFGRPDIGVFGEDLLTPDTDKVCVMPTAVDAAELRMRLAEFTDSSPAIIATAGFPLPAQFRKLRTFVMFAFAQRPLMLPQLLRAYSAVSFVENQPDNVRPRLRVCRSFLDRNMHITPADFQAQLHDQGQTAEDGAIWIVRQAMALIRHGQLEFVQEAFSRCLLSEQRKAALANVAVEQQATPELITIIQTSGGVARNEFVLANGRMFRRVDFGLKAVYPNRTENVIANVKVEVKQQIYTQNGQMHYLCQITKSPQQAAEVRISPEVVASHVKLKQVCDAAFIARGQPPYVAFYPLRQGFAWPDIFAKLAENSPVVYELPKFGSDERGVVQLPKLCVRARDGQIMEQVNDFSFPPAVIAAYDGLTPQAPDWMPVLRGLLEAANNVYIAGLVAGVMHITHQLLSGLHNRNRHYPHTPEHLFYVENEPAVWQLIFRQLCRLFSGVDAVPRLPHAKLPAYLDSLKPFGTLPYPVLIGNMRPAMLQGAIANSPIGLISPLEPRQASAIADETHVTFAVPEVGDYEPATLADKDLERVREAIPAFWAAMAKVPVVAANTPATAMYTTVCNVLGLTPHAMLELMTRAHYTGSGDTSAVNFLRALYQLLYSDEPNLSVRKVEDLPDNADLVAIGNAHIFVLESCVLASKGLVSMAKRRLPYTLFQAETLDKDLARAGYTIEPPANLKFDRKRFWAIDKKAWNKYVRKQPIELDVVSNSNAISLAGVS